MHAFLQRRSAVRLAEEKNYIFAKIFRFTGARTDNQKWPVSAARRQRQRVGARSPLQSLNSLAAGPISLEKVFDSLCEGKLGHEKKVRFCSLIFGSAELTLSAACSAAFAHASAAWLSSFTQISKKDG